MNAPGIDHSALDLRSERRGRPADRCAAAHCDGYPWRSAGGYCLRCWAQFTPDEKEAIRMTSTAPQAPPAPRPGEGSPPEAQAAQNGTTPKVQTKKHKVSEEVFRATVAESVSFTEAGRKMGISNVSVGTRARRLGITPGKAASAKKAPPKKAPTPKAAPKAATPAPAPAVPVRAAAPWANGREIANAECGSTADFAAWQRWLAGRDKRLDALLMSADLVTTALLYAEFVELAQKGGAR